MSSLLSLADLGWQPYFQQQLTHVELEACQPVRVMAVSRGELTIHGSDGEFRLPISRQWLPDDEAARPTVGDWLLLDAQSHQPVKLLERKGLFQRRAPGERASIQLIAANIDTVFIVSSCNDDFKLSRLERYLAVAYEAEVKPVFVFTKADLCADPDHYRQEALTLGKNLTVTTINARDRESCRVLEPWLHGGQTITLIGSSGTGKSTLVNTLSGQEVQLTGAIRADDAKGRHTTTRRSMHRLESGTWLVDTPGMRELQLAACEQGVAETFEEVAELKHMCRFNDCQHEREPGCAIREAIESGTINQRRVENYLKLMSEQQRNSESIADRHKRSRSFSRHIKSVQSASKKKRGK